MKRMLLVTLPFEESLKQWLQGEPVCGTPSLFYLAETLANHGVEIQWLMLDWTGPLIENRSLHRRRSVTVYTSQKPTRRIAAYLNSTETGKVHRFLKLIDFCRNYRLVAATARHLQPDLVYATSVYSALGIPVARSCGAASVTRLFGLFLGLHLNRHIKPMITWNEILALRLRPDLFIITNDGTQGDRVAARYGIPPARLWFPINGVDPSIEPRFGDRAQARGAWAIKEDALVILTVGRLVAWKRMDRLIQCFARITERTGRELVLVCAGDGPLRGTLKEESVRLGVSNSVRFLGNVSRPMLRMCLAAADVVAFTYDHSNVGSALLEALWAGKPIITLANGDTERFVLHEKSGLVVDPGTLTAGLDESLLRLVGDPELRRRLGAGATAWARANLTNWATRMDQEYRVLCDVVVKHSRGRRFAA